MDVPLKLEGSLAERDLPEIVQDLKQRRWSGVLTLSHMGIGRRISLQDGRLVFASSTNPDDRLGEVLLRRGRITLEQYMEAGKAISPGKRLGTVLVEQGLLDAKALVLAVVEQTQEIICGSFQWTEGHYRLSPGAETAETITLKISTPDLIMEGIRRIESWCRIERGMGGGDAVYHRADDYEDVLGQMALSLERLTLLTDLNSAKDVRTICAESTLPDFEVCRILWGFRVIGLIRRVDSPPARRALIEEDDGLGDALESPPDPPDPPVAAVEPPPVADLPPSLEVEAGGRKKILIVGIPPELFDKIDPLLSRSYFAVERAEGAADALAACARSSFDLVIAGHPPPDGKLDDFLGALRSRSAAQATPLLALAEEARLAELRGSLSHSDMALPLHQPRRLLEEVASRLLGVEPRVAARIMVRLEMRLERGKRLVMCQTENVSKVGMLVRSDQLDPLGTKVTFETLLPGARSPVYGEAEVVRHSTPHLEDVRGMGLRFLGFKADGLERLCEFLDKESRA